MPNKATREIKELARALTFENPKYVKNLRARLESGECPPAVEVALLYFGYGKPVEQVEVTQPRPFIVRHSIYAPGVDPLAPKGNGVELTVARPALPPPG